MIEARDTRGQRRRGYVAPVQIDEAAVVARALLGRAQLEADVRTLEALIAAAADAGDDLALATLTLRRLAVEERLHAIRWALAGGVGSRITDDLNRSVS